MPEILHGDRYRLCFTLSPMSRAVVKESYGGETKTFYRVSVERRLLWRGSCCVSGLVWGGAPTRINMIGSMR